MKNKIEFRKRAVILLSGGLDSAVTLYIAKQQGYECFCLAFKYGQLHRREVVSAKKIARAAKVFLQIVSIELPWGGSALLDRRIEVPENDFSTLLDHALLDHDGGDIPSTYVPARNTIFLSFALSYAEAIGAEAIFIGAHTQDYSGYPDCRPEFFGAFSRVMALGTRAGVQRRQIMIKTPLIHKNKAQIIKLGASLRVPFRLSWSCYKGGRRPCGTCDSCLYRAQGFKKAGIKDPL